MFDDPTVGILYPGEMGAALGRVLREDGRRVVTTLEGRGGRTRRLCAEAGLRVLGSLAEVAAESDVVVSLVPPDRAVEVARAYAAVPRDTGRRRWFLDANSVAPQTAEEVAEVVTGAGAEFIDAAVHGLAARLRRQGVLYLSGRDAPLAAAFFGKSLRVRVVGEAPGRASALKGLLAGLSKGLVALFLESAVHGAHAGLLADFLDENRCFYPALAEVLGRLVPTYPQHAGRRAQEVAQLEQAMRRHGLCPRMAEATRRTLADVADCLPPGRPAWTVQEVAEELTRQGFLAAAPSPEFAEPTCTANLLSALPQ